MTIHLSKELERFIHDAVRAGRYASEDDVIRDALTQLKQSVPDATPLPAQRAKRAKAKAAPAQPTKPLTVAELHQKLLAEGRISRLPDTGADFDDPDDQPITIEGEPLSQTVIRERR
jgi:Arc/MetJ-type ribon-helix-helix transcriptional regulator